MASSNGPKTSTSIGVEETSAKRDHSPYWSIIRRIFQRKGLSHEFDGSWGYNGYLYRRPLGPSWDLEQGNEKHTYLNQFGLPHSKSHDVAVYYSKTKHIPRRLIVQATDEVMKEPSTRDWRTTKIRGSVPTALRLSEWALRSSTARKGFLASIKTAVLTTIVAVPLQVWLALPWITAPWEEGKIEDTYLDWPAYHWAWPKYAKNPLDMAPDTETQSPLRHTARVRLLEPRKLVVRDGDEWINVVVGEQPRDKRPYQYVFVSYTNEQFHTRTSKAGREQLECIAAQVATEAGCEAYYMDFRCRAADEDAELLTADVNRFCDVIRGARRIVVVFENSKPETLKGWGDRMWTLPEGLLATGNELYIHYADTSMSHRRHKVEMAADVWSAKPEGQEEGEDLQATRLLTEHYTGTLSLGRLELFSVALAALSQRIPSEGKSQDRPELAYALMGLLSNRLDPLKDETLFQCIARLSLSNDSDRLMERMVCMLPAVRNVGSDDPFLSLAQEDQYKTRLWDVQPSCQVVGVGKEDYTVVLDSCRAIPIRWKSFPRLQYEKSHGTKKYLAKLFVDSGAKFFLMCIGLIWIYIPFFITDDETSSSSSSSSSNDSSTDSVALLGAFIAIVAAIGFLLSFAGPASVRRLYGGSVMESSPHLVGFEGTMPIEKLEKTIFGNCTGRLSYEASSTPFCHANRDPKKRIGREPGWIKSRTLPMDPPVSRGHRLFTLVDTGNLSVSIFEAVRPPTVALICGREGGMLRTVLCSWSFKNDCLYRESVMRMPTDLFEMARPKSWLKLSLESPMRRTQKI